MEFEALLDSLLEISSAAITIAFSEIPQFSISSSSLSTAVSEGEVSVRSRSLVNSSQDPNLIEGFFNFFVEYEFYAPPSVLPHNASVLALLHAMNTNFTFAMTEEMTMLCALEGMTLHGVTVDVEATLIAATRITPGAFYAGIRVDVEQDPVQPILRANWSLVNINVQGQHVWHSLYFRKEFDLSTQGKLANASQGSWASIYEDHSDNFEDLNAAIVGWTLLTETFGEHTMVHLQICPTNIGRCDINCLCIDTVYEFRVESRWGLGTAASELAFGILNSQQYGPEEMEFALNLSCFFVTWTKPPARHPIDFECVIFHLLASSPSAPALLFSSYSFLSLSSGAQIYCNLVSRCFFLTSKIFCRLFDLSGRRITQRTRSSPLEKRE